MPIIQTVIKGKEPVIDTLSVTPSTSAQQITATGGTDGYSPVNVSAVTSSIDANIVAGNIKKDVQILGVTGSYEGTTPTGTLNISTNGTHNVANYEYADVDVPTTAPAYYIEKTKDANGVAQNGSHLMDFSTFTDIGDYVFNNAYNKNTSITGIVDFSSLTSVTGAGACNNMFYGCTGITGVDLSNLERVTGAYSCCQNMFYGCTGITGALDLGSLTLVNSMNACSQMFGTCTGITSVDLSKLKEVGSSGSNGCSAIFTGCTSVASADLSSLTKITGSNGCANMFLNCTGLTSFDLSQLTVVLGNNGCSNMFSGCTGITSVDLSALTTLSGNSACSQMFSGCTNLASINISKLAQLGTNNQMSQMFRNCTSLTSLSFNNLAYTATNINSAFNNTLQGVTGCTVHFPSDWQTDMANYSNITNGLGGTNTTVLFDLPAVTTLDLSHITSIDVSQLFRNFAQNNYFPNITGVDLSSLTTVSGDNGCSQMFYNCSGITSINLSSLTTVSGSSACTYMFGGTGITSVDLSSLTTVSGQYGCSQMFYGCTSLATVYIGGTTAIDFGTYTNQFFNMFLGCTQNIDVYAPAANQATIEAFPGYPNFGGTGTVTWHWRS